MNILQAKNEIKNTVKAYLSKNRFGEYEMDAKNQRPLLLIGPPGIGKTQIMEQISKECQIGLVSYTITHHTRQSAVPINPVLCLVSAYSSPGLPSPQIKYLSNV